MVTIKDVANRAGVSVCTASRALSGKGSLKEETRQKVLNAVEELNYKRNSTAANLKTKSSNMLVLIVPDITNVYYTKLAKYVEHYANGMGYMVFLCNSDNNIEKEKGFIEYTKGAIVKGVLITPCTNEYEHVMQLRDFGIPYVFMNRFFVKDADRCVRTDNEAATYEIIKYFIDNGFNNIGGMFQSFINRIYEERYSGMVRALKDNGLVVDKDNILFGIEDIDNCHVIIKKFLARDNRPDALFASNDMIALEIYRAAYELGISIPEDLSVIGYDDTIMARKVTPGLTSYKTPSKELAEICVKGIINNSDFKDIPALRGELIIRDSVIKKSE